MDVVRILHILNDMVLNFMENIVVLKKEIIVKHVEKDY